jgi:hypothetical protein
VTQFNNAAAMSLGLPSGMKQTYQPDEGLKKLVAELHARRNHTDKPLLAELQRCGTDWKDGRYRCGTPACPCCRRTNIKRAQRETRRLLDGFENGDLAFITVVAGATTEVSRLGPMIRKTRQDMVNRFASARRKDSRWHDTYVRSWFEIDAAGPEHMPLLPPQRRGLVPSLCPMPADSQTPMWMPSFHGVMFTNGLPHDEIKWQFGKQWKLDNQIDVKALWPHKLVAENLDGITSYANKHHTTVSLDGNQSEQWPVHWQAQYFGWLHSNGRNPFESLRMSINQYEPKVQVKVCKAVEALSPMPFVYNLTSVPMSYNTGAWP